MNCIVISLCWKPLLRASGILIIIMLASAPAFTAEREITITGRYLNLPVDNSQKQAQMIFLIGGETERSFDIRLSNSEPEYWVFADMKGLTGKKIIITYPEDREGLDMIYSSDQFRGQENLYHEKLRQQFHFTSRRGWNNDPNGLVYYDGEYHLFYQHNPYGTLWGNMHWGHAVSIDLVYWTELPDALYPDELGTMFSGSAAIDVQNTSGFQTGKGKVIVAAYTANNGKDQRQTQCIAYSNDRGWSFNKYSGNPVIDSKDRVESRNTRDPRIFWYESGQDGNAAPAGEGHWVMVLFEGEGNSIYTSSDMKEWKYESHVEGFWECPELFKLPVDGDNNRVKWVMYGAIGSYMLGSFDGKVFTPETEALIYTKDAMYAAQTFNNIPETDGRRIQIGWGRIKYEGEAFNQTMCFPTELTLRTTDRGIRLFNEPVEELGKLHGEQYHYKNLSIEQANRNLQEIDLDLLQIQLDIKQLAGDEFYFTLGADTIVGINRSERRLNGQHFDEMDPDKKAGYFEVLVDRVSVEVFMDHGRFTTVSKRQDSSVGNNRLQIHNPGNLQVEKIKVFQIKPAWE